MLICYPVNIILCMWLLTGAVLPPWVHWQCLVTFLILAVRKGARRAMGGSAAGIEWVGTSDAANHPHRTGEPLKPGIIPSRMAAEHD